MNDMYKETAVKFIGTIANHRLKITPSRPFVMVRHLTGLPDIEGWDHLGGREARTMTPNLAVLFWFSKERYFKDLSVRLRRRANYRFSFIKDNVRGVRCISFNNTRAILQ